MVGRRIGSDGAHGSKVVGGGVFRCCVPWCGARAAAPVDDADYALNEGSPELTTREYGKLPLHLYGQTTPQTMLS